MFKIEDRIIDDEWAGFYRWKTTEWKLIEIGANRIQYLCAPGRDKLEIHCSMAQLSPILTKYEQKTDFKDWEISDLAHIQERQA